MIYDKHPIFLKKINLVSQVMLRLNENTMRLAYRVNESTMRLAYRLNENTMRLAYREIQQ